MHTRAFTRLSAYYSLGQYRASRRPHWQCT